MPGLPAPCLHPVFFIIFFFFWICSTALKSPYCNASSIALCFHPSSGSLSTHVRQCQTPRFPWQSYPFCSHFPRGWMDIVSLDGSLCPIVSHWGHVLGQHMGDDRKNRSQTEPWPPLGSVQVVPGAVCGPASRCYPGCTVTSAAEQSSYQLHTQEATADVHPWRKAAART